MAEADDRGIASASAAPAFPIVRKVTFADLGLVLAKGWADFKAEPAYGLFFGAVYALGGLLLIAAVLLLGIPWLAYPLVIGFALIGPFVATGLYEVSRLREAGRP